MARKLEQSLVANAYPGRGIVIGQSPDGRRGILAYFIMGRSENSRNRVFIEQGEELVIHPFDPALVSDPSLIIYSPVRVLGRKTIVTNGDQTDTVYDFLQQGKSFEAALNTRCFEPDSPNFTPRISGILHMDETFSYQLSILKAADSQGSGCNRLTFSYHPIPGLGHFIHTYDCNGDPLPSFTGEPREVELPDCIDDFAKEIWSSLNSENKISAYIRYIDLETGSFESRLINKNA